MLNKIDLSNKEVLSELSGTELEVISKLISEFESGKRITAYKKITKSGSFINRYEYDDTKWKYILTNTYTL